MYNESPFYISYGHDIDTKAVKGSWVSQGPTIKENLPEHVDLLFSDPDVREVIVIYNENNSGFVAKRAGGQ